MENLEQEIKTIQKDMLVILDELDKSSDDLYPDNINSIVSKIENKRNFLKKRFPAEELLKYEENFLKLSKQIKRKTQT